MSKSNSSTTEHIIFDSTTSGNHTNNFILKIAEEIAHQGKSFLNARVSEINFSKLKTIGKATISKLTLDYSSEFKKEILRQAVKATKDFLQEQLKNLI